MLGWWEASLMEAAWDCRGGTGLAVLGPHLRQHQGPRLLGTNSCVAIHPSEPQLPPL